MFYLAINNITDDNATFYKCTSLIRLFEYINTNDVHGFTLTDIPFYEDDEEGNEIYVEDYQIIE